MTLIQRQTTLQLPLYSGIALIVLSMLFLGRQQASSSFALQAIMVLAAPAFFYIVGVLVYRYLRAPLAAPGIIATGAWLVGVGLIHLYDKRILMPEVLQAYYWFGASLIAGALISVTGHRIHIWLLVPLVPLVQINAMWATMSALGLAIEWIPSLSFILVLLWWEFPLKNERWSAIYRVSAVFLTCFLLIFSLWLPVPTSRTLMTTWGMGALVVAILSFRHGWARLGPLTIVMLVCASLWGLPSSWFPVVWLLLAALTILFIERMTVRHIKDAKVVELSEALAVVLCGVAALFAEIAPLFGVVMHPLGVILVLTSAGILLIGLGWRRNLRTAIHAGLWLVASAWGSFYFVTVPASGTYGLWLALFACCALLIERLLTTFREEKRKAPFTLVETVVRWPFADLVIGLSAIILLWSALHIGTTSPWVSTVTLSIIVGVWVTAGLVYRLPILLHIALWIAVIPYSLLLILAAPAIWTLPLMGVAWQVLGVGLLVFGHSTPKYRPAVLAPFFLAGYALVGIGLIVAMGSPILIPLTLGIVVLASITSGIAVIFGYHPAWDTFVEKIVPPDQRPYAFKNVHNLFLFLSAWLAAIWLQLMLGYTRMPLSRQGVFLVVLACIWFLLGRTLTRIPGLVGWHVISAGWLLWLIGLLQVFFSPTEAIITVILGLAISGEVLYRSRAVHWIPVFVLQLFFTVLQAARMLSLPGHFLLLILALVVSAGGMLYSRRSPKAGRVTAVTGAALALGIALFQPSIISFAGITALALIASLYFRRWQGLWLVYAGLGLILLWSGTRLDWITLFVAGLAQMVMGAEIVRRLLPRLSKNAKRNLLTSSWATPFLTIGCTCSLVGLLFAFRHDPNDVSLLAAIFSIGMLLTIYALCLRIRRMPYAALTAFNIAVLLLLVQIPRQPYETIGNTSAAVGISFVFGALCIRIWCVNFLRRPFECPRWVVWWLRPMLGTAHLFSLISFSLILVYSLYFPSPVLKAANIVLLMIYFAFVYANTRGSIWLIGALGIALYGWEFLLNILQLRGIFWQSIPIGIGLLILARAIRSQHATLVESAGIVALVSGSVLNLEHFTLTSPATLILALHVLGLAVYGYTGGRRIPFASGAVLIVGSIVFVLIKINVWLILLTGGILLLACSLFVEVRRETAAQWTTRWITRWQHWK